MINNSRVQYETIKAFFKKHKLPEELKQKIANEIGQTRPFQKS